MKSTPTMWPIVTGPGRKVKILVKLLERRKEGTNRPHAPTESWVNQVWTGSRQPDMNRCANKNALNEACVGRSWPGLRAHSLSGLVLNRISPGIGHRH